MLPDEAFYTTACAFAVGWNDWTLESFSLLVSFMQKRQDLLHNVIVIMKRKTSGLRGS